MLLICKNLAKKGNDGKVKVIRPPYIVDRLRIADIAKDSGLAIAYLNEFNVVASAFSIYSSEAKVIKVSWKESHSMILCDFKCRNSAPSSLTCIILEKCLQSSYFQSWKDHLKKAKELYDEAKRQYDPYFPSGMSWDDDDDHVTSGAAPGGGRRSSFRGTGVFHLSECVSLNEWLDFPMFVLPPSEQFV